jgi:hypothetical protein
MLDGEWRLTYPGTDFSFGGWDPVANPFRLPAEIGLTTAPTIGDPDVETDDTKNPRTDGDSMGADYRGGRTVGFSIMCRGASESAALALYGRVAAAWRADTIRTTPGAYAELATSRGGRERLVYGRPRRFVPNLDLAKSAGEVSIECDFRTTDDRYYALADTGISLGFSAAPSGGLTSPLTSPLTSISAGGSPPGAIVVGGEGEVWPVVRVTAPPSNPLINPTVRVVNVWALSLQTTIPPGAAVTVDTRPGRRSVTDQNGGSYRSYLTRSSRLDRASLSPGSYTVSLTGLDNTGLSTMQFAWRHAYASL